MLPLNFNNFFPHLIIHPEESQINDREWTWAISIILGVFTLGTIHAGCALYEWYKKSEDLNSTENKIQNVKDAQNLGKEIKAADPVPIKEIPPPLKSLSPGQKNIQKILQAREVLVNQMEKNPYYLANALEVGKNEETFYSAFKNDDMKLIERYITNVSLKLINERIGMQIIENGKSVHLQCFPIIYCIHKRNFDLFLKILNHPNLNINKTYFAPDDNTPLQVACLLGKEGIPYIEALIEKKADPSIKNKSGKTALDIALETDLADTPCLQKLNEWTLLNGLNKKGETSLQTAIRGGKTESIEEAISKGICLDHQDDQGNTALHLAVLKGDIKTVQMLLEAGCKINLKNNKDETALYCSVYYKIPSNEEISLALLLKGADPSIPGGVEKNYPFQTILAYFPSNPVRKCMMRTSYGLFQERQNANNIRTIFGLDSLNQGPGNYPVYIFESLNRIYDAFLKENTNKDLPYEAAKDSITLAAKLVSMDPDEAGLEAEKFKEVFPLLLPTGWKGHSISAVYDHKKKLLMIQNRGERTFNQKAGVQIYECDSLNANHFSTLLNKNKHFQDPYDFNHYLKNTLRADLIKTIPAKDQKTGNCTWASSACLGLQSLLTFLSASAANPSFSGKELAETFVFSSEGKSTFQHYAKKWILKDSLNYFKDNLHKVPCNFSKGTFIIKSKLLKTLRASEPESIKFKKAKELLDILLFSGHQVDVFSNPQEDEFIYNLYEVKDEEKKAFRDALTDQYFKGNFVLPHLLLEE